MHTTPKTPFQFRFDRGQWQDVELTADNLEVLVASLKSSLGTRYPEKAFPEIHAMVLANHEATKALTPSLYGIQDLAFDVRSNEDDVLKISYSFTMLFGNKDETEIAVKARNLWNRRTEAKRREITLYPHKEPRAVEGLFTVMPGN